MDTRFCYVQPSITRKKIVLIKSCVKTRNACSIPCHSNFKYFSILTTLTLIQQLGNISFIKKWAEHSHTQVFLKSFLLNNSFKLWMVAIFPNVLPLYGPLSSVIYILLKTCTFLERWSIFFLTFT